MRHKSLFQDEVLPFATECLAGLDTMLSLLQSHDNIDDKEDELLPQCSNAIGVTCTNMYDALLKLKLPRIKPRWADLTDAGPGVGVSNFGVRFRDAEIAPMFNSDYRKRCHRSRGDSGQGEAERTNSAIGDAVIDGATIEWEHEKLFDGMSNETTEAMSKEDFDIYDRERMERKCLDSCTRSE